MQTVDVAKLRRRKQISIIGQDHKKVFHFQLAAFKVIHGGHYILGPKSKRVSAGKGQLHSTKTEFQNIHVFIIVQCRTCRLLQDLCTTPYLGCAYNCVTLVVFTAAFNVCRFIW